MEVCERYCIVRLNNWNQSLQINFQFMAVLGIRSGLYASLKSGSSNLSQCCSGPCKLSLWRSGFTGSYKCCGSGMFFRIPDPTLSQPESLIPDAHQRIYVFLIFEKNLESGSTCFLWPPGSGSISQRYGSGSGSRSLYQQGKIIRKTCNPTILWFFFTFYLWKW